LSSKFKGLNIFGISIGYGFVVLGIRVAEAEIAAGAIRLKGSKTQRGYDV
jgi:hypothetical protein